MHGACFSVLNQGAIGSNIFVWGVALALHYFYERANSKFDLPRKASSERETIYTLAAAVDATFSKTTEQHCETMRAVIASYFIHTFSVWFKNKKLTIFSA